MTAGRPRSRLPDQAGRPDPLRLTAAMPISRRALFHLGSTGQPPAARTAPSPGIADRAPGRTESPAAPLGEITVAADRCSACGCCALACPTGALAATYTDGPVLMLSVDAASCSACGACVSACPEAAVSLGRVADSASLAAGRRPAAAVAAGHRCESCGRPLAGGLAGHVVGRRLARSHPEIAARLRHASRCADCLLTARRPGTADPGHPR